MISVDRVSKSYGSVVAVDDLSFQIDRGEVVGFLGPNGAGKTTTMRMLTGCLEPDAGAVLFDGEEISEGLSAAKRRVGYLPETNALYPEMLVSEYLEFTAELRDLHGSARWSALGEAVERTGVGAVFTRPISEISKGFRQRVGLAACILHQPEILVLDEPTEGLDPNQRVEIRRLVSELGEERTVLLSTHVLAEVEATCDRLLIIHEGRLVADGGVSALLETQKARPRYIVEAQGDNVPQVLERVEGVSLEDLERVDDRVRLHLSRVGEADLRPEIFRLAIEQGWVLWELHRERATLEQLFRTLTEEEEGAEAPEAPAAPDAASAAEEEV